MLLPQSSAFAALKNRLNSVSAIGYLHIAPRAYVSSNVSSSLSHFRQKSTEGQIGSTPTPTSSTFDRPNRLKAREEGVIKWVELLDKFKSVQEKARRAQRIQNRIEDGSGAAQPPELDGRAVGEASRRDKAMPDVPKQSLRPASAGSVTQRPAAPGAGHKPKSSLGNFGRLTGGVGARKTKR